MTEPTLFDSKAPARPTDPETSHAAARTVNRTRSQRAVLAALREVGPMAHHTLCLLFKGELTESRTRTAVKELRDRGMVRDSGMRVRTPSGRQAVVWEAI